MKVRRSVNIAVATAMTMMVVAACSSSESPEPSCDGWCQATGQAYGDLRVYNAEPAFLNPSAASDEAVDLRAAPALPRSGHVQRRDRQGGDGHRRVIESSDQKNWTVSSSPASRSRTASRSTPTRSSAWNYVVRPERPGQRVLHAASRVSRRYVGGPGRRAEGSSEAEGARSSRASRRSATTSSRSSWPSRSRPCRPLGYSGFFPVAEACSSEAAFRGLQREADRQRSYKIEGSWEHNVGIKLVRE